MKTTRCGERIDAIVIFPPATFNDCSERDTDLERKSEEGIEEGKTESEAEGSDKETTGEDMVQAEAESEDGK